MPSRPITPRATAGRGSEPAPSTAPAAQTARPAVLENRGTTSDDVFQRILRKLQREENFNAIAPTKDGEVAPAAMGQAQAMLAGQAQVRLGPRDDEMTLDQRLRRDELQEEEGRYGEAPSPGTLRAIVENVRATVNSKLELAAISSVKDTMKLVFESRTLLDKLLKDIPSHGNMVDVDGKNKVGTALPAVNSSRRHMHNTVQLKELFQEFKQAPVSLPNARYGVDSSTGKVVPVIAPRPPMTAPSGPSGALASASRSQVDLARLESTSPAEIEGMDPSASASQSRSLTVLAGSVEPPPGTAAAGTRSRGNAPMVLPPGLPFRDQQALLKYIRRQTQHMDTSQQTEETISRMVPEAEHQYALARISQLEVHVGEYEGIIARLHAQLDSARGAILSRSKVVAYLKETLYRETCMLRAQLNQVQMRNAIRSDGSLDASTGTDYSMLHSLLDTVMLAVEKNRVLTSLDGGSTTELTPEEQLRRVKIKADDNQTKLRKQLMETRLRANLIVQRKTREVRMMRLANDVGKLREVVLEQIGSVKADLNILRQDVKSMLSGFKTALTNVAQELEYGTRRTSVEVGNYRQLRGNHRAVQDALGALDDMLVPVMKPEFATGSHPWAFARNNEPLVLFLQQSHSEEVIEAIAPELRLLQRHYSALQRFALSVYQQPDLHNPAYGRVMVNLGQRMLAHPECSNDLLAPIRNALARDRYLAGIRARINLTLKYYSYRKSLVTDLAESAMKHFGYDLDVQPIPRSPALRAAEDGIARCKKKKVEVEEERVQNAKALYGLWRTSSLDLWEGKRAPVTRNPEAVWAPAPPMSKARRTARINKSQMAASGSMLRDFVAAESPRRSN